jgi:sugar lactone lactonase YvrE
MSSEDATGRRLREDAPMTALSTLIDGIDFGEGPRWHEGRLWYSDFDQPTVHAVDAGGEREPSSRWPPTS